MQWRRYAPRILDNLIWFILVGVFIFFVIGTDKFLTPFNIVNILSAAAVLGIVVVGQTFVLITGNFDLSQESTLGLSALVGLWIIVPAAAPYFGGGLGVPPILSIVIILAMGVGIGALIKQVNAQLSDYEQLRMIVVAREPWTIENGCLTPTMKIKRSRIETEAEPMVDKWYEGTGLVVWA